MPLNRATLIKSAYCSVYQKTKGRYCFVDKLDRKGKDIMNTSIIAEVARIIWEHKTGVKIPKSVDVPDSTATDAVQISPRAQAYVTALQVLGDIGNNDREMKIRDVKQKIELKQYEITPEMLEVIAENLASAFI